MLIFLFTALLLAGKSNADEKIELVINGKVSAYTAAELSKQLKVHTVRFRDPHINKEKSYQGFWLQDLLKHAGLDVDSRGRADELIFTAKDGYSPTLAFELLKQHRALVAFGDAGKNGFTDTFPQGKSKVSPAPFYLVWPDDIKSKKLPWPYQLVKIEAIQFKSAFAKIYPAGAKETDSTFKGFLLFKNECLKCHSVNLQGGDIGPELNIPKNVTEYWQEKTLLAFIRRPDSFRAKSKMPNFGHLADSDIGAILDYLKFMKNRKILP